MDFAPQYDFIKQTGLRHAETKKPRNICYKASFGVEEGIRTLDLRNHNPSL